MGSGTHFFEALRRASTRDVEPVARLLEVQLAGRIDADVPVSERDAQALWRELSYCGSHGLAYLFRGGEGIDYAEIVRDACDKRGVKGIQSGDSLTAVQANERMLVRNVFTDIWDRMSEEERRELLRAMDLDPGLAAGAAVPAVAVIAGELGGFATYQLAVIVANAVARALLGRGLSFAAGAALTRALGVVLGPVGWIASGAWLAIDLAGPAYRKTVPAVIQVAALREAARVADEEAANRQAEARRQEEARRRADRANGDQAKPMTASPLPQTPPHQHALRHVLEQFQAAADRSGTTAMPPCAATAGAGAARTAEHPESAPGTQATNKRSSRGGSKPAKRGRAAKAQTKAKRGKKVLR